MCWPVNRVSMNVQQRTKEKEQRGLRVCACFYKKHFCFSFEARVVVNAACNANIVRSCETRSTSTAKKSERQMNFK